MADTPHGPGGGGKLPRNRFRLVVVLTVALILVVVFGYLLLVSQIGQ